MTIKQKVFISLKKKYETSSFKLEDIRREIWIAQGKNPKKFYNKQGYYMVAINDWVGDRLLNRSKKNTYKITFIGCLYAKNPTHTNRALRKISERKEARIKPINNHEDNFKHLVGKQIVNVRRLTPNECGKLGWNKSPLVLELDDSTCLIPQTDDEGNDGGAMLHYDYKQREGYIKEEVIYHI
tara:strand:- start:725 stop:1273 length:549 start_codon:yes stop_codon:yes gene_type:complete